MSKKETITTETVTITDEKNGYITTITIEDGDFKTARIGENKLSIRGMSFTSMEDLEAVISLLTSMKKEVDLINKSKVK